MIDPTRVLLLGAGRMGLDHVRAIQQMPEVARVVAAMDPSQSAREMATTEFGIDATYGDLHEALGAADADAVIVAAPNFLHAEYTLAALDAGLHVFVEKPMALTLEDVDAMVASAKAANRLLMSGQSQRFSPQLRYVKHLVDQGKVGTIRHVVHRRMGAGRGGDENSWFSRQAQSGGILPGIGVHSLDVLLWWLNDTAKTVFAVVQNREKHPAIDIEDETSLVAVMRGGAILNAALSFNYNAGTEWIVAGDDGVLHVGAQRDAVTFSGELLAVPSEVPLAGETSIQREFFTAIRDARPLAQAAGHEIRDVMALIFAAQESGRTGLAVEVQ